MRRKRWAATGTDESRECPSRDWKLRPTTSGHPARGGTAAEGCGVRRKEDRGSESGKASDGRNAARILSSRAGKPGSSGSTLRSHGCGSERIPGWSPRRLRKGLRPPITATPYLRSKEIGHRSSPGGPAERRYAAVSGGLHSMHGLAPGRRSRCAETARYADMAEARRPKGALVACLA